MKALIKFDMLQLTAPLMTLLLASTAFAGDDATIATIGKQTISMQDLTPRISATLDEQQVQFDRNMRQLKLTFERERQAYKAQELGALVNDRVLALEAAARKTTPAALTAAIKVPEVSDSQARAFYDANKSQIEQPYDAVAERIKIHLRKEAKETAEHDYFASLRSKYKAVILLEPLREQVAAVGPQRGPDAAPVTIVEFSDFQCPFCGRYAPTVQQALAKYPTQVKLIYRHLPLPSLHPNAQKAAEAAVCARDQGKFWQLHDLMFAEQGTLEPASLKEKAKRLGLDTTSFNACLDTGKSREIVQADVTAAEQLGLSGTPGSFINGRFVNGAVSLEDLSEIIDDELRRAAPAAHR